MPVTFEPATSKEHLLEIEILARSIWSEYYVSLIGRDQVEYMVERFQTLAAMQAQIAQGYQYYGVRDEQRLIGYLAILPEPHERRVFVSKFYLVKSARGSGTGRQCMEFIERRAQEWGLSLLWLTVNKRNPSVEVYRRLGFQIAGEIVIDIGEGFVMDDYRMEKRLAVE